MSSQLTIFFNRAKENLWFNLFLKFVTLKFLQYILFFFYFLQFLVELKFYVVIATATATAVINFSTTALEPQPWFLKMPQPKQERQPRFSENSQPIHH